MKRTPMAPRTKPMKRGTKPLKNGNGWHALPHVQRVDPAVREGRQIDPADPGDGTYKPRHVTEMYRYGAAQVAALFRPTPKDNPLQHEGYMAIVRKLPCARCGRSGPIQFCHADVTGTGGKGKGIKSDCRLGWPGCGPHGTEPGCHWFVGTSGKMSKAARHDFEFIAGRETRDAVERMGLWPASLPRWNK